MKLGRNDPCSCGSGKKYKHCCQGKIESGSLGSRTPVPPLAESNQLIGLFNAGRYAELESKALVLIKQYPNAGHIWMGLGLSLQMQGKDALHALQKTVELMPGDANAHNNLANTFRERGQLDSSVASCRRALKIQPDLVAAHNNLGLALLNLGQRDVAVSSFRRALALHPNFAEAHSNLGLALKELGQFDAALVSCRRALELKPDFAEAHNNLGITLKELNQLDAAQASYRRALKINPDFAEAHNNLASVLKELGQFDEAVASYQRALQLKPEYAEAHSNLGNALKELGQFDAALLSCRRAIELKPDLAEAHNNLGITLTEFGQLDAAQASYRQALELKPDFVDAHNNLGITFAKLGQFDEAVISYRRALQIKPDFTEAHSNLGNALKDSGQHAAALASYRQALEFKPDFAKAFNNLLFTLNYTTHSLESCLEEARKFGRMVDKKMPARFSAWQCAEKPERLRVGMVSGDLHNHPVSYALKSLLAHLDPARVELIAYSTNQKVDEFTALIKPHFAAWKPIYGLNDEAAARLIHADGLHVLLDLSGHTEHNRLPMFAWKSAPVQASWLGYFATTGVTEMDYLLTSEVAVPKAHQRHFTETVWYLPDTWLCFTPPEVDLPVVSLPALQNGYLTFGCFQRLDKIGEEMLSAWANIFTVLPTARVKMACKQLGDPAVAAQFVERLQRHDIDPARVTMQGAAMSREEYLTRYAEVDVMLDTFPYPGVTTTCEALWMGVPTLTLAGATLLSRQGAGVLTAAGLPDWAAASVAEYIDKAVALAGGLPKLAKLRAGLREQVSASPLFDAKRFARNFEEALWGMWLVRTESHSLAPELMSSSQG
jgi:protein O-GlcNAc transferase